MGFAIENILAAAPANAQASFYRTAAGAEIDLVLEIPNHGLWAIEIKRGQTARLERGFHVACDDVQPTRKFVVNGGQDHYPLAPGLEAISLPLLAQELVALV